VVFVINVALVSVICVVVTSFSSDKLVLCTTGEMAAHKLDSYPGSNVERLVNILYRAFAYISPQEGHNSLGTRLRAAVVYTYIERGEDRII
jgi:hypothetical protein